MNSFWPWFLVVASGRQRLFLRARDGSHAENLASARWRRFGLSVSVVDVRPATAEEIERHLEALARFETLRRDDEATRAVISMRRVAGGGR